MTAALSPASEAASILSEAYNVITLVMRTLVLDVTSVDSSEVVRLRGIDILELPSLALSTGSTMYLARSLDAWMLFKMEGLVGWARDGLIMGWRAKDVSPCTF